MVEKVYILVEGKELSACNDIESALSDYATLSDFVMKDAILVAIAFNEESQQLEPVQVELKEIAKVYSGEK